MASAFLSLGSNQGDREEHLRAAVEGLHAATDIRVEAASPVYETEAHTARPDEERAPRRPSSGRRRQWNGAKDGIEPIPGSGPPVLSTSICSWWVTSRARLTF